MHFQLDQVKENALDTINNIAVEFLQGKSCQDKYMGSHEESFQRDWNMRS